MIKSSYYLKKGDVVSCMKCSAKFALKYEPAKCCISEQDAYYNQCGCRGVPEPIFCDTCWEEIEE